MNNNVKTNHETIEVKTDFKANNTRHGFVLKFPFYLKSEVMDKDISELELTVRSMNCLKRTGYNTIGQLVEKITRPEDLNKIRNMGTKSRNEVLMKLFIFQYNSLSPEKQQKFIKKVEELNFGADSEADPEIGFSVRELMENVV